MKSYLSGFACACLVWFCCTASAGAQQPADAPEAGAKKAGQEALPTNAQQPAAPPAAGAPQAPDRLPVPDQQDEPGLQGGSTLMTVPELPKIPDVRMPGEQGISLGMSLWFANSKPGLEKGSFPYAYPGNIDLQGKPKVDQGFEAGVALGLHNVLRVSFFQTRASGNINAPSELGLITQVYLQGDYLATDYHLQSVKLSFDYLTWPYPVKTSRFRLKTLWQVQYLRVRVGFDAPYLAITDSLGNPLTDSSGNLLSYATEKTYQFYLPEVGLGVQEWVKPGFRLEASGSGFSIPHHQNSWNFETSANFRASHYELRVGVRGYHFRTSAQQDFWVRGTMVGPFFGLRWYSDEMKK